MSSALKAVLGGQSVNKAATDYGIPRSTLRRRVKQENKVVKGTSKVSKEKKRSIPAPICVKAAAM